MSAGARASIRGSSKMERGFVAFGPIVRCGSETQFGDIHLVVMPRWSDAGHLYLERYAGDGGSGADA